GCTGLRRLLPPIVLLAVHLERTTGHIPAVRPWRARRVGRHTRWPLPLCLGCVCLAPHHARVEFPMAHLSPDAPQRGALGYLQCILVQPVGYLRMDGPVLHLPHPRGWLRPTGGGVCAVHH